MVGGMVTAHHNLVGSARVSTVIQDAQLQRDALTAAGPKRQTFADKIMHTIVVLPVSHPNRHNLPWLRSARWFFLATTSLTLSGLTIDNQDTPGTSPPDPTPAATYRKPSWLRILHVDPE